MGYEGRDNLTSITDLATPANSEAFTYTPRESLAGAVGPYGTLGFTYDGVGNRITYTSAAGAEVYSYPITSNRLSAISLPTGGNRAFTYDASGNVTFDDRTGGAYGYSYNAAGRMFEFRINGFLQASYQYDALGRQAIRSLTSPTPVTIHSVFDSQGRRIAEYDEATGGLLREYIWNGWDPVALIEGGTVYYVRADHIGRPVFATNASGAKVWTATYQPFGGVHVSTCVLPACHPMQSDRSPLWSTLAKRLMTTAKPLIFFAPRPLSCADTFRPPDPTGPPMPLVSAPPWPSPAAPPCGRPAPRSPTRSAACSRCCPPRSGPAPWPPAWQPCVASTPR